MTLSNELPDFLWSDGENNDRRVLFTFKSRARDSIRRNLTKGSTSGDKMDENWKFIVDKSYSTILYVYKKYTFPLNMNAKSFLVQKIWISWE